MKKKIKVIRNLHKCVEFQLQQKLIYDFIVDLSQLVKKDYESDLSFYQNGQHLILV